MNIEAVDLIAPGLMGFAQHEEVGSRLALLLAQTRQAQQPHHLGTAGAVDDLFAGHPSTGAKPHAVHLPASLGFRHGLGELIVGDLHARLRTLFLGQQGVGEHVDVHLVVPVPLRHLAEIGQRPLVEFHALFHQFPADAGNDLLAPGIKETRERDATRGHGAAKLAAALHQQNTGPGAPGLQGGNGAGGTAADDKHVNVIRDLGRTRLGRRLGLHGGGAGDGGPEQGVLKEVAPVGGGGLAHGFSEPYDGPLAGLPPPEFSPRARRATSARPHPHPPPSHKPPSPAHH